MLTKPQRALLRDIRKYGGVSPDAETIVGLQGAPFQAVLAALYRKSLIDDADLITDAGRAALTDTNPKQETKHDRV